MKCPTHCATAALAAAVAALLFSSGCNHSDTDRGSGDKGDDSDPNPRVAARHGW